jgi:hypothetical protein
MAVCARHPLDHGEDLCWMRVWHETVWREEVAVLSHSVCQRLTMCDPCQCEALAFVFLVQHVNVGPEFVVAP